MTMFETFFRILDGMSTPAIVVSIAATIALGIFYLVRHEDNHNFNSDQYAFEYKRSKGILRYMVIVVIFGIFAWGMSGISTPYIHEVIKEKIVIRFPNLQGEYAKCMGNVNLNSQDYETYEKRCREYVHNLSIAGQAVKDEPVAKPTPAQAKPDNVTPIKAVPTPTPAANAPKVAATPAPTPAKK
jgi:hypothetical protein